MLYYWLLTFWSIIYNIDSLGMRENCCCSDFGLVYLSLMIFNLFEISLVCLMSKSLLNAAIFTKRAIEYFLFS